MMAPWPGIRRGTDCTVPRVPGLVSDTVVPAKSSGLILPVMDLADQLLVGEDERTEVERVGLLDARDEQRARAVALLLVDRQPEPDVLVVDDARLARPVDVGRRRPS